MQVSGGSAPPGYTGARPPPKGESGLCRQSTASDRQHHLRTLLGIASPWGEANRRRAQSPARLPTARARHPLLGWDGAPLPGFASGRSQRVLRPSPRYIIHRSQATYPISSISGIQPCLHSAHITYYMHRSYRPWKQWPYTLGMRCQLHCASKNYNLAHGCWGADGPEPHYTFYLTL